MWGEMLGEPLRGGVETLCSGNFLEFVKVILMRIRGNGGYRVSTGLIYQLGKASNGGSGLNSIELLVEGSHENSPHISGCP